MSQEMFLRKIPEDMRPWECNVNGVKYVYPAGTEQNVPAEVAAIIDAYWEKQAVDHPETGISFNDLRDKPFYESMEVLFDQRVEFRVQEYVGGPGFADIHTELSISAGDFLKVALDGVEYGMEVFPFDGVPNGLFFGNRAFLGGEDNGIPFAAITAKSEEGPVVSFIIAQTASDPEFHTIRIEKSVIHTIDPKYLPETGAGFNVNVWYDSDALDYVSDKTYAQIKAAEEAKTPIVGTFTLHDGKVFTMIGCDSALPTVNLVAFNLNSTPDIGVYHVSIDENLTNVAFFGITATQVDASVVYPK